MAFLSADTWLFYPRALLEHYVSDPMLGWVLTVPFNMLSTHPVLSVPAAQSRSGVPIGIQIVGRPFDDDAVFRAGLAFETARGPWFADRRMPAGLTAKL